LDCNWTSRHFTILGNTTISGITFIHGIESAGGCIFVGGGHNGSAGSVLLNNCNFINCNATNSGGAIFVNQFDTRVSIDGVNFNKCSATYGGAIFNNGTIISSNSIFTSNIATHGGAVMTVGPQTKFDNVIFANNSAQIGGALYKQFGSIFAFSSTFKFNYASVGGAIYIGSLGTVCQNSLTNLNITLNAATVRGGGIAVAPHVNTASCLDRLNLLNCSISNNEAPIGGGLYIPTSSVPNRLVIANNVMIFENKATMGGGMFVDTANDSMASKFVFTGLDFSTNVPSNIQCAQPIPFCIPCSVPTGFVCGAIGSEVGGASPNVCYTNKTTNIACNNGYCIWVTEKSTLQYQECNCDSDWTGEFCDQEVVASVVGTILVSLISVGSAVMLVVCIILSVWKHRKSLRRGSQGYQALSQ